MAADHIGYVFFPDLLILRIIGRLAFPLFSYFIYEGSRYTRNIGKYFVRVFGLGALCLAGYAFYTGQLFGNILLTFSFSILLLWSVQIIRKNRRKGVIMLILAAALLILFNYFIKLDYGITGACLPLIVSLVNPPERGNHPYTALIGFGAGLCLLSIVMGGIQFFCLLSLPLLLLYDGKRGSKNLQLFFYLFYPAHLIIIGVLGQLLT